MQGEHFRSMLANLCLRNLYCRYLEHLDNREDGEGQESLNIKRRQSPGISQKQVKQQHVRTSRDGRAMPHRW
jgi:hypothetical protein